MGDVVNLDNVTRLDIPAERVLKAALDTELTAAFVCGYTKDGDTYFASSMADGGDVLWLMEVCKQRLFSMCDE